MDTTRGTPSIADPHAHCRGNAPPNVLGLVSRTRKRLRRPYRSGDRSVSRQILMLSMIRVSRSSNEAVRCIAIHVHGGARAIKGTRQIDVEIHAKASSFENTSRLHDLSHHARLAALRTAKRCSRSLLGASMSGMRRRSYRRESISSIACSLGTGSGSAGRPIQFRPSICLAPLIATPRSSSVERFDHHQCCLI